MSGLYKSKTVIVTGSARGLGLATAQTFFKEDANVVVVDINEQNLKECKSTFPEEGREERLYIANCNVTDQTAVEKLFDEVSAKFGRVDVLVNNAAVSDSFHPAGDCPRDLWDKLLLINLTAPFITTQVAIQHFLKQTPVSGVILNVASAAGQNGFRAGQ
jgi:NAD(P)-dependent dehydrogenase (short-subunit alcohol dehydrogenase family)